MFAKPIPDLNDPLPWDSESQGERPLPQDTASVRIRQQTPVFTEVCKKCGGSGAYRGFGRCFACKGKGKFQFKTSPEARAANRAGAQARKERHETDNVQAVAAQHPEEWAWLLATIASLGDRLGDERSAGFRDVLISAREATHKYGELSEGRLAMIRRGMVRDAERVQERQARALEAVARSVEIDTRKIEEAFQRRREAGQIKLGLHYRELFIGPMPSDPAALRVKASKAYEAAYYGKIKDGRFFPTRDCPEEITAKLAEIAADPAAAARVSGKDWGICCCCGLTLTAPESIAAGIGPICAGKWGF